MKKNLSFISLALACLTAAPLASAETWEFSSKGTSHELLSEAEAWRGVNRMNAELCKQGIYAGKYSPKNDSSACAAAPRKVGNRWVYDYYGWYTRGGSIDVRRGW